MAVKDNYYTVAEAAGELDVTRQTIYRWIKNGILEAEKIGRETLIEKAEIFRYRDKKVGDWLYGIFNNNLERNNYMQIREHLGYDKTDKIQRMGDATSLNYIVFRENKETEIVSIKNISMRFNKKTGHVESLVDPSDITRELAKDVGKRGKV